MFTLYLLLSIWHPLKTILQTASRLLTACRMEVVISQLSNRQEEEAMVSDFYPRIVVLTSYVRSFTQLTIRLSTSPFFSDFNIFFTKFFELCNN